MKAEKVDLYFYLAASLTALNSSWTEPPGMCLGLKRFSFLTCFSKLERAKSSFTFGIVFSKLSLYFLWTGFFFFVF